MTDFPGPDSRNVLEPDCERCPALAEARERIAWGNGDPDASVLVVGEAPGAGEPDAERWRGGNWTGTAFTTRHSGRRIRDLIADAGYGDDSYYTNAVKCFPEGEDGSNREPTAEERANCRVHLERELASVAPDVIVPAGKHATASVFALADVPFDGFLETVLEPLDPDAVEPAVVPILHPSYQDVWVSRLGYEPDEYVATFADVLDRYVD